MAEMTCENDILPATTGTVTGMEPAMELKEIHQKNAALWVHYSNLSLGMSKKCAHIDNGACMAKGDVSRVFLGDNSPGKSDTDEPILMGGTC
jgi:hypothetical protein